jgi:hypothetical protein
MTAVILVLEPAGGRDADHLANAAATRVAFERRPGFIAAGRFPSIATPGTLLMPSVRAPEASDRASCQAHEVPTCGPPVVRRLRGTKKKPSGVGHQPRSQAASRPGACAIAASGPQ